MFKKISKHAKRRGLTPTKVLFTIEVKTVSNLLPVLANLDKDAILSVCFERGGKMSCSTGIPFDPLAANNTGVLEVNQNLSLVATLYQDINGAFQEKTAKLILRQLKTSRLLGNVYKGLGVVTLKLDILMHDLLTQTSKSVAYPMEILKGGAVITVTISTRLLSQSDDEGGDDCASLMSDSSDISMMGATFDPEELVAANLSTSTADGIAIPSQGSLFASPRTSVGSSIRRPSMSAVHEGDEEECVDEVGDEAGGEAGSEAGETDGDSNSAPNYDKGNKGREILTEDKASPSSRDSTPGNITSSSPAGGVRGAAGPPPMTATNAISCIRSDSGGATAKSVTKRQISFSANNSVSTECERRFVDETSAEAGSRKVDAILAKYSGSSSPVGPSLSLQKLLPSSTSSSSASASASSISTSSSTTPASSSLAAASSAASLSPSLSSAATSATAASAPSSSARDADVADETQGSFPYDALKKVGIVLPPRRHLEELELLARIKVLEQQLVSRDKAILGLKEELEMEVDAFKDEVSTIRADLVSTRFELKRERTARKSLQTGYVTEGNILTSFLSTAEKDLQSVTAEYAQCCAELQNVEQDLAIARQEIRRVAELREEERKGSIEAATVATAASLRRAELEEETDGMIEALIESKVLSADLALLLEEERNKNSILRRRMQRYAEKMGAMELSAVIEGLRRKGNHVESRVS